jgi:hypothetical protein
MASISSSQFYLRQSLHVGFLCHIRNHTTYIDLLLHVLIDCNFMRHCLAAKPMKLIWCVKIRMYYKSEIWHEKYGK